MGRDNTDSLAGVLEITGRVLQRADLEADDDFFDVDGTSLAAMQIVWAIQERFGVPIQLREFFDATTLGAVATLIDSRLAAG